MDELIHKSLSGELDDKEQRKLDNWLGESNSNKLVFEELKKYWETDHGEIKNARQLVWKELNHQIGTNNQNHDQQRLSVTTWKTYLNIAAMIVAVIGISFLVLNWGQYQEKPLSKDRVKIIEKVSLNGQKITVALPDGSIAKLNSGSKLLVPDKFTQTSRSVELIGEGFFEVKKDAERPFIVKSGNLNVKVLGTSFNVRSYPNEASAKVAVRTGKVEVDIIEPPSGKKQTPVTLVPSKMAIYSKKNKTTQIQAANPLEEWGWKDGIIFFHKTNIQEILVRLESWYGVSFDIRVEMDQTKDFSGEYREVSLESLLESLSYVYGFNFTIDNKTIILN